MKNLIIILLLSLTAISCDKINQPLKQTGKSCGVCEIDSSDEFVTKKAVLLEEFTGVTCVNCPEAAREAKRLLDLYPEQLIQVSIHAGSYAVPTDEYPADFRTPEGSDLFKFANPVGVPTALIDRLDHNTSDFVKFHNAWEQAIEDILTNETKAKLGIKMELIPSREDRIVCVNAKFRAEESLVGRNISWSGYLIESDIIAAQKDGSQKIEDYQHNHVLRTTFHQGAFGTPLPEFDGTQNSTSCDSRQISIHQDWEWENCAVVIFAYDSDTYEVLQVVEEEL